MKNGSLKISIENVQAVEQASIEVNGFTGIVGRSNSGKSAFIRGLYAALMNKAPKSLFRWGSNESRVVIEDKLNEINIDWRKGDKINQYIINGEKNTKVGKDQPEKISEFGFKPIKVNDEWLDVQFAKQFFPLFLLDKSGGFVADFISKITKADILTSAMKDCESDDRKTKDSIKHIEKDITKLNEDLKRFDDLDYYQTRIKNIQKNKEIIDEQNEKIKQIETFISEINVCEKTLLNLSDIPETPEVLFDVVELQKISEWVTEIYTLKSEYEKINKVQSVDVPEYQFDVDILKDIENYLLLSDKMSFETPDVPEVSIDLSSLEELEYTINELKMVATEVAQLDKELTEASKSVEKFETQKINIEKELGSCPVCNNSFSSQEHKKSKHEEIFV